MAGNAAAGMPRLGYSFAFGSLFGYATFSHGTLRLDGSEDPSGAVAMWFVGAVIGCVLLVRKDWRISNPRLRLRVSVADIAVLGAALVLIGVLPGELGLVRGVVLVALFYAHLVWLGRLTVEPGTPAQL